MDIGHPGPANVNKPSYLKLFKEQYEIYYLIERELMKLIRYLN